MNAEWENIYNITTLSTIDFCSFVVVCASHSVKENISFVNVHHLLEPHCPLCMVYYNLTEFTITTPLLRKRLRCERLIV